VSEFQKELGEEVQRLLGGQYMPALGKYRVAVPDIPPSPSGPDGGMSGQSDTGNEMPPSGVEGPVDQPEEEPAYYQIHQARPGELVDYSPKGGNRSIMSAHEGEVMLAGPSETGKTLAWCWKLHLLCIKYPGMQGAIVRKTKESMYGSVLQTFDKVIAGSKVVAYGNKKVERYIYPNGSVLWVGGMDHPSRILSSERDIIYVNQAEELTEDEWETLTTRTTGRGAIIPHPQLGGDCNPGPAQHWILRRSKAGSLRFLTTTHNDNPTLFNTDGSLTEQGTRTMTRLDALTGVRYQRLRKGMWVTAEGAVYDMFDRNIHVKERWVGEMVNWYLALDDGFTNPAVILLVGEDSDGRWHIFREFYKSGYVQDDVAEVAREWAEKISLSYAAVDAAAPGLVAALKKKGVSAVGSKGKVLPGIRDIQNKLKTQEDGKPRLTVSAECVETINEFESYIWMKNKDEPVDAFNHSMGALRYLQDAKAGNTGEGEEGEHPFAGYRG